MASNYSGFYVYFEDTAGEIDDVGAGVSVAVREQGAVSDVAESPLTTDSTGYIAAGSFAAVTAGTRVHFRVENYNGLAGAVSQVTT
jgi:hypothetical protein